MASRILLLDLDPEVRTLLRRVLTAGGFSVFEAENLDEAEQLVSSAGVDLLIGSKELLEHNHPDRLQGGHRGN